MAVICKINGLNSTFHIDDRGAITADDELEANFCQVITRSVTPSQVQPDFAMRIAKSLIAKFGGQILKTVRPTWMNDPDERIY
jgi:hypothetical protein